MSHNTSKSLSNPILTSFRGMLFQKQTVLFCDGHGRWIIAKHRAVDVLKRLHSRQQDVCQLDFESLLTTRVSHLLFRYAHGHQPHSFVGTFRRLMRDSGLLKDQDGQNRTLYSLRHTYATTEMLAGNVDNLVFSCLKSP